MIAPHPDDEALCCAGVISTALARGQRVHVLVMTNGGTWGVAAAALTGKPIEELASADFDALAEARRAESVAAMKQLGLPGRELSLLGDPDNLIELYGPTPTGATPASRAPLVATLARAIAALHPREVYAPSGADTHPGHAATHAFVRDALLAVHWRGQLLGYVIHSGDSAQWPWPATMTPDGGYEAHEVDGRPVPYDVVWPPPLRVPLTPDTTARKRTVIRTYASQMAISGTFLESFVKNEEIFWPEAL